ncbi:MAG: prolyl oligopeptidase family serine peptidase [Myxococcales bacterium]|nr:prolyl oligopeptidase family serine peptidase [Myxococcales bacterium]
MRRSVLALGLFVGCARPAAPADDAALPATAVADAASDQGPEVHDVGPDVVDPCPGGHDAPAWSASAIVADRTPLEAKVVSDTLTRARVEIAFALPAARTAALDLGRRAGDTKATLDGKPLGAAKDGAPLFVPEVALGAGQHRIVLDVNYGKHIGKLRAAGELALGTAGVRRRGLLSRTFVSEDGTTQTLVAFLPRCLDLQKPHPLVVTLPGWSNGPWTFGTSRLLDEAERRGFVVLTPETRGNVLYTGQAERGVLEAIEVLAKDVAVDRDAIHLTGVSMGGAGALQLGYHFPDRFASIVAFYGDSRYDRASYVGKILRTQAEADRYSVLLFPENVRSLPVVLVHAVDDAVSPFMESKQLFEASKKLGLGVELVAPPKGGHTLETFEAHVPEAVASFARRRVARPSRVTFRTSSADYARAYWLEVVLAKEGVFGVVDVSLVDGKVRVDRAEGVRELRVDLAAAGLTALVLDGPGPGPASAVPVVAR